MQIHGYLVLPTGGNEGDHLASNTDGQVVPPPIMHIVTKGQGAPLAQVEDDLAGNELDTQLQLLPDATDSKEEGIIDTVRTKAQHEGQLGPKGGGNDGVGGGFNAGPLREDEPRLEWDDSRRNRGQPWGPSTRRLLPAKAQPLEDIHI